MFRKEQKQIEVQIKKFLAEYGIPVVPLEWKGIPFSGHWGISTPFFQIAAQEARSGKKVNVGQRAQEIAEKAAAFLGTPEGFERIEAVRGYLNIYFSTTEYAQRVVNQILEGGDDFGKGDPNELRVMVEFSNPNTHKTFHVAHLRGMILGHAICNILEHAGFDVVRANYLGDSGLHVIKWLWNYRKNHAGEVPDKDKARWIGEIYIEANRLYSDLPQAEVEVRDLYAKWDQQDEELHSLWETSRKWSLEGLDRIYEIFGVSFDRIYFESEVEESGKVVVDELIQLGLAKDERPENAVIIPLDEILGLKEDYRTMVVLRSDGTSLYSTKDLALAVQKFKEYDLHRSIYVIDVSQSLHIRQVFKTLELMGKDFANKCHHLAFEIVFLPGNVKISSREGAIVLLEDFVNEAVERALAIVQSKNPDLDQEMQRNVARKVAIGAMCYPMISRDNTKVVTFDWETALDFNGQASPYIQYAYVRGGSILRKADDLPSSILPEYEMLPAEIHLIDVLSNFPREVSRSAAELKTMHVANYAYELARAFSDFYKDCPVLIAEEPAKSFRLRLVAATRQVLKSSLTLLGIPVPEIM